jgi:hypothetical protein
MDSFTNNELKLAYDFAAFTNKNIFLTGKAGTGKTTFLHNLKRTSPKRMIVVAPTGVAAINAGGVTIHSFFQLPFHPFIPIVYLPEIKRKYPAGQDDHSGYKMSREKINIIRGLDLLVIDEISMVRADVLDAIDSALRKYKNRHLPFGGVQLLMIGDLQQLAPVVKDEDREILRNYYDSYFFFGSRALGSTDYVTIELNHIYRQNDQGFIRLLNKIRDNKVDQEVLADLNKRYNQDFDPDSGGGYITLTTHNNQARALNDSKLQKLPGPEHAFKAIIKDEFPELSFPNDNELILKKGAQVMFVKNDLSGEKLFFNGKIGKVESFEDDIIVVRCPDDDLPINVEKAEWQNMKYTLDEDTKEIEEAVIGTFTQYPLKLAWAITIHKSQGLTFDRAVIDASAAFAHGQVYVALSRCRTLDGLVLSSRINQRSIIDNPVISGFISESAQRQPGPAQLAESKKAYQQLLLTELFDFSELIHRINYCIKVVAEHSGSILGNPQEMLEKTLTGLKTEVIPVSGKFHLQVKELLNGEPDPELNAALQDRVKKAAIFFSEKIEDLLKEILAGYDVETDNKAIRKSVNEAFTRARKDCAIKLECLNAVKSGFLIIKYLDARAKSAVDLHEVKSRSNREKKETFADINLHPDLFQALKDWRNNKAHELDVPHYQVLHQKTLLDLSNVLPATAAALKLIKGIGQKKARAYGDELLELIASYCEMENILPSELQTAELGTLKKKKPDTKKISLDLFNEGKSVSQIAEERKLSITTIEGHLAYYVSTGDLPVDKFVTPGTADLIASHFDKTDDFRLGPVKEALGERVTWSEIRFVASHLKFLRKSGTERG